MGERVVVSAVILVMTMVLVIFMVEMFLPLSANLEFRDICRNYLMKMEFNGGLKSDDVSELNNMLADKEFTDITIIAPVKAKFGDAMELFISVKYTINSISSIFSRGNREYMMEYRRATVARKAIN